jgi:hypothetical protein
MLSTTDLHVRLNDIEVAYLAETDTVKALLLAKLAALEVGGWTEECIDKIVTDFLDARRPRCRAKVMDKLNSVYGFQYGKEFRSMMVELVGVIGFEQIEDKIGLQCQQLESALAELKQSRDRCAHTYTKPTMTIDGPTKIIGLLNKIEAVLGVFCRELNRIQLQP